MKKIAICILTVSALLVLMIGCGSNSGSGRNQGEIYGECFKDNTCNEGLVCDTEHNTCVRDEDYSDDAGPDTGDDYDNEADDQKDTAEPEEDNEIYEETMPDDVDVYCWEYKCKDGKSYCGYKKNGGEIKWAKIETCAFSECIASTGKCGCDTSEDGKIHCESDKLHICSNGKWQITEQCKAGCDSATDSCRPWEDPDSGLEWSMESNAMIWKDAVDYCDNLTEGGFSDWRLPSISEARTLILHCLETKTGGRCGVTDTCLSSDCWNYNCSLLCDPKQDGYYNKMDNSHTTSSLFWSASEVSDSLIRAWGIELYTGGVAEKVKNEYGVVRCVRGENHLRQCKGLPEHAFWNSASDIFSTWDGSSWQPSLTGVYNETSSEKECRFKCIPGYKWDGYKCILSDDLPECAPESPTPCKDYSSGLVWSSKSSEKSNWKDAVNYCLRHSENVGKVWFMPTIDELRTLVKKCQKAEYGGICAISEENDILSIYDVGERESCFCYEKGSESSEYNKFGDSGLFWSSSARSDDPDYIWGVFYGYISYGAGSYSGVEIMNFIKTYDRGNVRCVAR